MNPLTGIFDDVGSASLAAGLLTVILALFSLDEQHWKRKFAKSIDEHKIRSDLIQRYYQNRPRRLYDLVPHLALRAPIKGRSDRFRLRAQRASNLAQPLRDTAQTLARQWINTVGALAAEAAKSRVDLRPFLGTYHLGVIREGVIAVPIALSMMTERGLTAEELDRLSWGLALVELAVVYNSRARQQRESIYFTATGHHPPIGPVLRATTDWKTKVYDLIEFFAPPLRLPRRGRRRWKKWLIRIDLGVSGQ